MTVAKALAPVVLFAFKRPDHLRLTLEALAANPESKDTHVISFVDAPRDPADSPQVEAVCRLLQDWAEREAFSSLTVERAAEPKGLARSVIQGVGQVLEAHERVIVLEDDIVLAPTGLRFLNDALTMYADDPRVWSVSAYSPENVIPRGSGRTSYFSRRASSWGYGTWRRSWEDVEWENETFRALARNRRFRRRFARGGHDLPPMLDKQLRGDIDSWAVRWCARQAELGSLTLYPSASLVKNTGMDGSGTHSPNVVDSGGSLGAWKTQVPFHEPRVSRRIERRFRRSYVSRFRLAGSRARAWARVHLNR